SSMGFEEGEIREAAQSALEAKLIAYDGEDSGHLTDSDLIKITPSGFIHLRSLPHFIEYISSVAMHSMLGDTAVARRIADVWSRATRLPDLAFSDKHEVASLFADYMVREKARLDAQNPIFRVRCREAEPLVKNLTHTVNLFQGKADRLRAQREARMRAK